MARTASVRAIGPERLAELEPHVAGVAAIHVPEAGIVDYRAVCERLARESARVGTTLRTATRVLAIQERDVPRLRRAGESRRPPRQLRGPPRRSPRAPRGQRRPQDRAFPRRVLRTEAPAEHLCRNLIYPVPDPASRSSACTSPG